MGHITAEVLPDDDVPCRSMSSIELLLNLCGDVFLDVVLFEQVAHDWRRAGSSEGAFRGHGG